MWIDVTLIWSRAHTKHPKCLHLFFAGAGDFYCSGNDLTNFTNIPEDGIQEMARRGGELLRSTLSVTPSEFTLIHRLKWANCPSWGGCSEVRMRRIEEGAAARLRVTVTDYLAFSCFVQKQIRALVLGRQLIRTIVVCGLSGQEVREGLHRLPEATGRRGQRAGCWDLCHSVGIVRPHLCHRQSKEWTLTQSSPRTSPG